MCPPFSLSGLSVYDRLQQWRRRQQVRWPGLFLGSVQTLFQPRDSLRKQTGKLSTTIGVRFLRNRNTQIIVNDTLVALCDGCGSIQQLTTPLASSDSTQSPQQQTESHPVESLSCDVCGFVSPLGPLRRLLRLPSCGPVFSPGLAFALLVEAVGAPKAIKSCSQDQRSWFLDADCRSQGLDALLAAIGVCDEQLCVSPRPCLDQLPLFEYCMETERFLKANAPHPDVPSIPFSIADLMPAPTLKATHQAIQAAQRSANLVEEVKRIWKTLLSSPDSAVSTRGLFRLNGLSHEYLSEQAKARKFNHNLRPIPNTSFHATQPRPTEALNASGSQ